MTRPLIIHHNDLDGVASAWAALQHPDWAGAETMAADYGEDPPDADQFMGRPVLIVDFSYSRDTLEWMNTWADGLQVFEHHDRPDLDGLPYVVLDKTKSGATLTWRQLHSTQPSLILRYVEDYDLWKFELPDSDVITAALNSYPYTVEQFRLLERRFAMTRGELRLEGEAIVRYRTAIIQEIARQAHEVVGCRYPGLPCDIPLTFRWLFVAVQCSSRALTAKLGGYMASTLEIEGVPTPFAAVYYWDLDLGAYHVSLRSVEGGVDVAQIARRYGGGGHKHAAGFRCEVLPWVERNEAE